MSKPTDILPSCNRALGDARSLESRRTRRAPREGIGSPSRCGDGQLRRTLLVSCLQTLTLEEAHSYLRASHDDELEAGQALARDRNVLDGSPLEPDDTEVHHALFLLRRARGLAAPSFDLMRFQLRRRAA
jgi:hypothetical protein